MRSSYCSSSCRSSNSLLRSQALGRFPGSAKTLKLCHSSYKRNPTLPSSPLSPPPSFFFPESTPGSKYLDTRRGWDGQLAKDHTVCVVNRSAPPQMVCFCISVGLLQNVKTATKAFLCSSWTPRIPNGAWSEGQAGPVSKAAGSGEPVRLIQTWD